ncbi:hypothetical protein MUN84_18375 [Hymenobacter sp. 5516J-16]|uniref:hypothetical protein n=1 Tax=Hymenobacter sp. 5516J-16 TaxID=2932253 RepID=UPI001FD127A4|nr:hypothetical protein [Hymenobacter sp. 5516J-16]UOQ76487.1 hypothetical protein MUN84_18375 [Hymenobacter sp. 5516J-16]
MMAEDEVESRHHTFTLAMEYATTPFNFVLSVCDHARETCSVLPGATTATRLYHSVPEPARATGSEAEIRTAFQDTRDQIKAFAIDFVRQHLPH